MEIAKRSLFWIFGWDHKPAQQSVITPLEDKPWRKAIDWDTKTLREDIRNIQVKGKTKVLNILFIGQAGAGKSSFINTVVTALYGDGEMRIPLTVYSPDEICTTQFNVLRYFRECDDLPLPIRLYDCRGIDQEHTISVEDIKFIIDGNIKPGYELKPKTPIRKSDEFFRENPTFEDKMHCVVYVGDGTKEITDSAGSIYKRIRLELEPMNVPQLVLMTKIDKIRSSLSEDVTDVFRSREVKEKCLLISDQMQLPALMILPSLHYHGIGDTVPSPGVDYLALLNIQTMIRRAKGFVAMYSDDHNEQ